MIKGKISVSPKNQKLKSDHDITQQKMKHCTSQVPVTSHLCSTSLIPDQNCNSCLPQKPHFPHFQSILLTKATCSALFAFTTLFSIPIQFQYRHKILKRIFKNPRTHAFLRSSDPLTGLVLKSELLVKLILHSQIEKENGFSDEHLLFC